MFISDLFRSFLAAHNATGFGAADFVVFAVAALLLIFMLLWRAMAPWAKRFAGRTLWCMLLLAVLPVALRLALLPHHPVPSPDVYDEFSHLLVADTLRHFRLANPMHPMHRFFETFFVLQQPTYSSIYPLGQGLSMAIGRAIFGLPWAGVLLSAAALCSLCYWMLRGWTTPGWALLGGLLAVVEFGPLSAWTNSYWGGAFVAAGGCLVFGALPRLRDGNRPRDAALLGLGLAINLLTRPYESIFLVISVLLFYAPALRKRAEVIRLLRPAAVATLVVMPAIALTLLQNKAVTGSWTTLPYTLSQYQYGVPATLTIQANAVPHRELTPQQAMDYKMQRSFHGEGTDTPARWFTRLEYRVRFYRFFFLAPLYLAIPAFFSTMRQYRFAWVAGTLVLFALGINLFPAFQFHYLAAVTCLFVLVSVTGLSEMSRIRIRDKAVGAEAAALIIVLCLAQFVFWYGMHLTDDPKELAPYEAWDAINHGNPEKRIEVNRLLAKAPGRQLVFVRYDPRHIFQHEWVWNEADINAARVVWARDLGPAEDQSLIGYYPGRTVWLLEPDFNPPHLAPYIAASSEQPRAAPDALPKTAPAKSPFLEIPQAPAKSGPQGAAPAKKPVKSPFVDIPEAPATRRP